MQVYLQTLEYRLLANVLLLILMGLVMDGISAWVRKEFLLTAGLNPPQNERAKKNKGVHL